MRTRYTAYDRSAADVRVTRFDRAPDDGWWLAFACSDTERFAALVAAIRALPPHWREWAPNAPGGHAWWIADEAMSRLLRILPGLAEYAADRATAHCRDTCSDDTHEAFAALHLLPSAPPDVVKAAFRALAKAMHPDVGGDTAAMVRVSLAYERALAWAEAHERSGRKGVA
jgi:hypothetical protein